MIIGISITRFPDIIVKYHIREDSILMMMDMVVKTAIGTFLYMFLWLIAVVGIEFMVYVLIVLIHMVKKKTGKKVNNNDASL